MKRILLTLAILSVASSALAWGEAGHLLSNEAAALSLPNEMPPFFHRALPQLVWLGYQPDRLRGAGPSLDAVNAPDHFLDYEMVADLPLPPDRYQYLTLLLTSGRQAHLGVRNTEPGFSPWRIAEMTEQLTAEFRQWRAAGAGSSERQALEQEIITTAGQLGHFVADAANPLHATVHYNGWLAANPRGYANDCLIHARFESDFVSRAVFLSDVTGKVAPPVLRADYFVSALAFLKSSNALVERLYQLDKAGAFSQVGPISAEAKTFVTDRLAAGSSLLRDYWWSAWKNSEKAPRRRGGS